VVRHKTIWPLRQSTTARFYWLRSSRRSLMVLARLSQNSAQISLAALGSLLILRLPGTPGESKNPVPSR